MDLKIVYIFCLCDDVLKVLNIKDNFQSQMSTTEIMTTGIVAALFFGGNIQASREFLKTYKYIPNMLSHSRLHRKLLAIPKDLWEALFAILKQTLSAICPSSEYIVDSCPLLACGPCRSWRCKLFKGKEYLGYCASKKLHYYGLNIHLIVSSTGVLTEFIITHASCADISALKCMNIDLPEHSVIYGDRAYSSISFEQELLEFAQIFLIPQRKHCARNQHPGYLRFL